MWWVARNAAAIVGAGLLLLAARVISPVPLPDLFIWLLPFVPIGLWVRALDHRPAPSA